MQELADAPTVTRFGRYAVGQRIGAGGMAVVDAAFQRVPGGGRLVALKRVSRELSRDPAARRMFLREASIAARIEHPNVVRTYEVGEEAGEAFIAMELLEGATVADLTRRCPDGVPPAMAMRIVRDALRGLHVAHELRSGGEALGLVHQDISPQNIHVAYEGTTRILDFGVARLAALDASRTETVRGKACYLAPEQLTLGATDRRADLFAIGIVLHELLTNAPLFPRARAEVSYAAILAGEIPAPRSLRADIPEAVDAVVRRALSRDVDARFASAEEMRVALLEAEESAGSREVDVAALGAWVRSVAPPTWTRDALERELASSGVERAPDAGAELRTLPLRRASSDARVTPPRSARRIAGIGVGAVALATVVGGAALLRTPRAAAVAATPASTTSVTEVAASRMIAREIPREAPPAIAAVQTSAPARPSATVAPKAAPRPRASTPKSAPPASALVPARAPAPIDPLATQ